MQYVAYAWNWKRYELVNGVQGWAGMKKTQLRKAG